MKDIIWKELSLFHKVIFCLGWLGVGNVIFWVAFLIVYFSTNEEKKYKKFFNPNTFKVVYVFGWVNIFGIILGLLYNILTSSV